VWRRADDEEEERARQTRGLASMALVLALALVGSYLVASLRKEGQIEDCLLARRTNCDALLQDDPPPTK
jgi:hypothetical protein